MLSFLSIKASQLREPRTWGLGLAVTVGLLLVSPPAFAHHPFGGETPSNAIQGFLSGLGHPVIGLDHLAFVIAAGLLAALMGQGLSIPFSFVLASLAGTGLHLRAFDLPATEFSISASVLLFGILLAMRKRPPLVVVLGLAALAGLFHGYAYGEAIVGADMAPLLAYLLGFTSIQMGIAVAAYWAAKRLGAGGEQGMNLRFAGFTLAGVGAAFLSGVILG